MLVQVNPNLQTYGAESVMNDAFQYFTSAPDIADNKPDSYGIAGMPAMSVTAVAYILIIYTYNYLSEFFLVVWDLQPYQAS
jgi:hypothetical protein